MKIPIRIFALLFAILLLTAWKADYDDIADLKNYPQNAFSYINKETASNRLISATDQSTFNLEYDTKFFFPWHHLGKPGYTAGDAEWAFKELRKKEGYGEDKKKRDDSWFDGLEKYADLNSFPNRLLRAITVRPTYLRMLPTDKPFFYTFYLDGEGYPFDNIQHSFLPPNTPIYVDHLSEDGQWALVESHHGLGWMLVNDLAYVTEAFVSTWENGKYAALIKDDVTIKAERGMFLFKASIGAQFPIVGTTPTDYVVMIAVSNEGRMAKLFRAHIPRDAAAVKPLALTPYNLAAVANAMIGRPYGWGGMYGNRDCSQLTKDFYSPFGIFLPTNSGDQAKYGRSSVDLSKTAYAAKKQIIMQRGVPFLTLVGMKGHAMIYIGNYRNQPMILHSFWGIRTADAYNPDGRHLVAKTCITTLQAGWEIPNRAPESELLNRVNKLSFVTDLSK